MTDRRGAARHVRRASVLQRPAGTVRLGRRHVPKKFIAVLAVAAIGASAAQAVISVRNAASGVISFWTAPIGTGAVLQPAGIVPVGNAIGFDTAYLIRSTNADPIRPVIQAGSWLSRCSGTQSAGVSVRVPDNFVIPDARPDSQPNNHFIFVDPDGYNTTSVIGGARCTAGGPVYGLYYSVFKGTIDDLRYGTHASGLSALGGAIRAGELSGPDPVGHALDVGVWGKKNLWWSGSMGDCFRFPARSCDSYAGDRSIGYAGTNPELKMGALLAIPANATPESLGITTAVGRKLLRAFQEYGAYITEDSAWDSYNLGVTADAAGSFSWGTSEQTDFKKLMVLSRVVVNNFGGFTAGGGESVMSAPATVPPTAAPETTPAPVVTAAPETVPAPVTTPAPVVTAAPQTAPAPVTTPAPVVTAAPQTVPVTTVKAAAFSTAAAITAAPSKIAVLASPVVKAPLTGSAAVAPPAIPAVPLTAAPPSVGEPTVDSGSAPSVPAQDAGWPASVVQPVPTADPAPAAVFLQLTDEDVIPNRVMDSLKLAARSVERDALSVVRR